MTEISFADIVSDLTPEGDALAAPMPKSWMQGRTAFGGLTAGLLLAAAEQTVADLPPVRSALVNFTGPVGERPLLYTEVLRRGRNVTTVATRAVTDGQTVATATFSFGASRDSQIRSPHNAPEAPPPETCELYIPEFARSLAPPFQQNFDVHLIDGNRPFMGAEKGYARAWARHQDTASREGSASLLCLADILPPAAYTVLKSPGPNSSMTWICNFLSDDLSTEDGWWQVETNMTAAQDGYSSQVMRMWNSRGDLVIDGMQAVAIFV